MTDSLLASFIDSSSLLLGISFNMLMIRFLCCFICLCSSLLSTAAQFKCKNQAEISALLQFKEESEIYCTGRYGSYSKTSSWNIESVQVKWDGVECDPVTGHVIGLDLSNSCVHGSINNNIFSLDHLHHLNLAFNNFSYSSIPSELSNLSRLTYLNLSSSYLAGQVPLEISSKLSLLDLSGNWALKLNLKRLVQNLTNLENLDLSSITITSNIPDIFTNMSSLRSLRLNGCGLYGEFPQGIFHLPNLQHLSIGMNQELNGYLPDFNWSTSAPLESLVLGATGFNGTIPASIGNLVSLRELDLYYCNLSGPIPDSIGNLVSLRELALGLCKFSEPIPDSVGNLARLVVLSLEYNDIEGEIPSSLANLTNLSHLYLFGNRLTGKIPSSLTTSLIELDLADNRLTGEIPPGLVNLTKLTSLYLSNNKLQGPLPVLRSLRYLDVSNNNLSGSLELDMFFEFNLYLLQLSSNNLTLLQTNSRKYTRVVPRLEVLGLSSCRLSKLPEFLESQHKTLYSLDLSYNNIEGPIPKDWMGNASLDPLNYLNLSHNLITGFEDPRLFLRWTNLENLDISFNKLQGSVPFAPLTVKVYIASNNEFTGEIPHSICNSSLLQVVDFSSNRLNGELDHQCFGKADLQTLNLRNNSFSGRLPELCASENKLLNMIDLNNNRFNGEIPRSLVNCVDLEFFNAGSNLISDSFPSWLGSLPKLKVLILRDNALHGSLEMPKKKGSWFPELRIIDLSRNNLTGKLPSSYFQMWIAMRTANLSNTDYMQQIMFQFEELGYYDFSLTMYMKGTEREYLKILDALVSIDLSSNRFEGEIPTVIGDLRGLRFLNFSNNHLSGGIPSSLGMLTVLESLDLSSNMLSVTIPQQLTQLTYLSVLNVSYNNLTGPIPQGKQFDTFQNSSYLGNPKGLCGEPLSKKCENSQEKPPPEVEKNDKDLSGGGIEWMIVMIGFAGGLVVGVAVENIVDVSKPILSFWIRREKRVGRKIGKESFQRGRGSKL